jgi:uncharacterized membrane protein (UPF0136 family)
MTKYDPSVIAAFADRLYAQANRIIVVLSVLGFIVGAIMGAALGGMMGGHSDGSTFALVGVVVVGAAGTWVGYSLGQERAFALKLQAQIALCQMQIEANTRGARAAAA